MAKKTGLLKFFLICTLTSGLFTACTHRTKDRIVIWTNSSDLVQYIELFNATHKTKAVLVYKSNPAASLPPENDELKPDLVIGPYLKTDSTKKYFEPVDYLFDRKYLDQRNFYSGLLSAGEIFFNTYLLPVSFNLPCVIFSTENKNFVQDGYTISPEEMLETGKKYNQRNKKNLLTKIGFSPLSSEPFLYTFAAMNGTDFREAGKKIFTYNEQKLDNSIKELVKMTRSSDISLQESNDFVYKYLSVVDTKRVSNGRSLFAYTTSNVLFQIPSEQLSKIDFRWVESDDRIPVEDSMVMMGISRYATNYAGCAEFIKWFYNPETQKEFLEMKKLLTSDLVTFGIAGGFSSIKEVNEHILPTYYTTLLLNIPQAGSFKIFKDKPANWEQIKKEVIIPYIKDAVLNYTDEDSKKSENNDKSAAKNSPVKSMDERFSDWRKQNQTLN